MLLQIVTLVPAANIIGAEEVLVPANIYHLLKNTKPGHVRKISPPTGIRSSDRLARSSVAIPTELPGPSFLVTTILICHNKF